MNAYNTPKLQKTSLGKKLLSTRQKRLASMAAALTLAALSTQFVVANIVTYEDLPTNDSLRESHHTAAGPILADDFVPAVGGRISRIDWWGTAAHSEDWEIAFHTNDPILNQPNLDNAIQGALEKHFVSAAGVADPGLPVGILHYTVSGDFLHVAAGTEYWFTVANFSAGWNWADALGGPTVGSENFNSHQSTGGIALDGGPHGGPWTDVHTDLAFRFCVPDSGGTAGLLSLAIAAVMLFPSARKFRTSRQC